MTCFCCVDAAAEVPDDLVGSSHASWRPGAQVPKVNADLHGRAWLRQETFLGAAEGQD